MLIKTVHFLFGKPCKKGDSFQTKFPRFIYWSAVVFYFFGMIFFGIFSFIDTVFIGSLISGGLFFPLIFRFVYFINLKMRGLEREV
ncbi:hypothetical protein COJ48_12285 [Bacillus cereus]|uniref:hypothetical protein n=1 Tax=Bacillus TaxID=1386 RepID=UPI000469FA8E|nr:MULTISPECIES: hypothetical protein [Bacillus]PFM64141.1 hypothetical protein COJ48_12285 [Bacillus cereus]MED1115157.1 hypothetical protein [Bacillus paramycoides]MED1408261.1 hypothetical protein [Bacillus paramycoides]MED1462371.1 hypothetical protein [Bacillus paramycoides]MED1494186.1 hypothetical protein [Bacillus paramycoides]